MPTILALWPIAKWVLQALGMLGPEEVEKERDYKMRLAEAAEKKDAALIEAFAEFQKLWRPPAERVYVWANTAIALFQPVIVTLVWFDVLSGRRQSITTAIDFQTAGIPGLLVLAVMLFPLYGPALVAGVGSAFSAAIERVSTKGGLSISNGQPKIVDSSGASIGHLPGKTPMGRTMPPSPPPASSDPGRGLERPIRVNDPKERGRLND